MDVANLALIYLLGVETAFTPCFLPVLPVFINFVAGFGRERAFLTSVLFVTGSTASLMLYSLLAAYGSSFVRPFLQAGLAPLTVGVGLLLVSLGVVLLTPERRIFSMLPSVQPRFRKISMLNALVLGFTFTLVAAPCAATFLVAAFSLVWLGSMNSQSEAILTALVYAGGVNTPFLLLGLLTGKASEKLARSPVVRHNETISGFIMILLGALTVVSVENYDLYSQYVAQALAPYLALLSLLSGIFYARAALRLGAKINSLPPMLLGTGILLLGISDTAPLFGFLPHVEIAGAVLSLASRILIAAGGLMLAKPVLLSVLPLAPLTSTTLVLDSLMLFSWIAGPGRRDRDHLFAALFLMIHLIMDAVPVAVELPPVAILLLQPVSYLSLLVPAMKLSRVLTGLRLLEEV
ncbi:cytochrome c biogenesis CcdA family protein [Infirmifilum sp. NZ]|uniref:cytochrome c biogenesis CcdA family protein n=1 Tax=Infirmifilum sp. NZ TaxID=2926850 RepID=UPI0027A02FF0|nr:cytochrome c biogenesis protein CcdA [Infirmifilum sp. NZ]UNQ74113.1 hypothetical protein MOV14_03620 [Infirmifilum sp. NZ]